MALSTHVGSFNTSTAAAGNTVPVTEVGFQPTAVIFWWTGRTESVDTVGGLSHKRGMGWATSTTSRACVFNQSEDNAATTNCDRAHRTDALMGTLTTAGAIDGLLDLQSFDADGFTVVIDDAFAADYRVHYFALGGADLTNAATGSFQEQAATGNFSVSGVGFQPDAVLFLSIGVGTAPPAITTFANISFGAAVSAAQQAVLAVGAQDNITDSSTKAYNYAGEIWANLNPADTSVTARATFVSMDTDGFTVNFTERSSTRRIFFLALKGGQYHVGNVLTATNTTNFGETGVGFQPTGAMFASHGAAQSTQDTSQNHDRWSIGAASSATVRAAGATLDENITPEVQSAAAIEHDEVYINIAADDTVQGLMDLVSFDADGMTLVMDDADPSQAFVWYLAVGSAPGGAAATVSPRGIQSVLPTRREGRRPA